MLPVNVGKIRSGEVYLEVCSCVPRQDRSAKTAHLLDGEREAALNIPLEIVRVGGLCIARRSSRGLPRGVRDTRAQHGHEYSRVNISDTDRVDGFAKKRRNLIYVVSAKIEHAASTAILFYQNGLRR